jgi:hypothetical protein
LQQATLPPETPAANKGDTWPIYSPRRFGGDYKWNAAAECRQSRRMSVVLCRISQTIYHAWFFWKAES